MRWAHLVDARLASLLEQISPAINSLGSDQSLRIYLTFIYCLNAQFKKHVRNPTYKPPNLMKMEAVAFIRI